MEDPAETPLKRYPKLAIVMGEDPDVAIFRRFGALNALILMRLQAELIQIEEGLQTQQPRDDAPAQPQEDASTKSSRLNVEQAIREGDEKPPNQIALLELAQAKLNTYCP